MASSSSPLNTNLRRRNQQSPKPSPGEQHSLSGFPVSSHSVQSEQQSARIKLPGLLILIGSVIFAVYFAKVWVPFQPEAEDRIEGHNDVLDDPAGGSERRSSCRIYMAPSSVKGVRGYGVYTTQPIFKGEHFLNGPDGPDILVTDFDHAPEGDPLALERNAWISLFDGYWWGRGVADQVTYESSSSIDFQIMFGSLPNHHCVLSSADHRWPNTPYDDTLVDRKDPGAGAFSYHMGREFLAMRDLEAGDEIFLNYGYCGEDEEDEEPEEEEDYEDEEPEEEEEKQSEPEWTAGIPRTADFESAAKISLLIWQRLDRRRNSKQSTIDALFEKLYAYMVEDQRDVLTDQTIDLIPKSSEELFRIMATRKKDSSIEVARSLAKELGTQKRSVEWILENGICVENLVPGRSQIEQAGQGAMLQFAVKAGEIVVPAPLLQIVDRNVLATYDFHTGARVGTQLLMNYCFGHHESSLLLCPDTNAILINHCSSRQQGCGPEGPNAEVRWASGWEKDNDRWLEMSIEELGRQSGRGLAIDVVATRDIQAGDEVFIDYGKVWEDAWSRHVQNWDPTQIGGLNEDFPTIKELNADKRGGPIPMLVSSDLRKQAPHPNVFTGCAYWWTDEDDEPRYSRENPNWTEMSDERILKQYGGNGAHFQLNYSKHEDGTFWPCTVIRSEDDDGTKYTVRIHQAHFEDQLLWDEYDVPRFLTNYSRSSIHYFRKPYTSEQHSPKAFRQPIGIPDKMFPERWKNRKE